jgi:hypothetical protein
MRHLSGGPVLHVRPNGGQEEDNLEAAAWEQYMSMIDPSDRMWQQDAAFGAPLNQHELLQQGHLNVDAGHGTNLIEGDGIRSDLAANGNLRSPPPHNLSLQDPSVQRSFMNFPQQHLTTSPRIPGHSMNVSAPAPASMLSHMDQMNPLDCLPQGRPNLSRRNSYSSTQQYLSYDVSTMVAELLHMVGFLKPTFKDRAVLMVAVRKCSVMELASIHAAMKGAWDRKSISEARQVSSISLFWLTAFAVQ